MQIHAQRHIIAKPVCSGVASGFVIVELAGTETKPRNGNFVSFLFSLSLSLSKRDGHGNQFGSES